MFKLVNGSQVFNLTIASAIFLLSSNIAQAEIYKWRNDRGVIQYSDKPPVMGFTKADRNEVVNALQVKELCAAPDAIAALPVKTTKNINANFFGFSGNGFAGSNNPNANKAVTGFAGIANGNNWIANRNSASPINLASNVAARPVSNQYSPLSAVSGFGFAGNQVSVFGSPVKTAQIKPTANNSFINSGLNNPAPKPAVTAVAAIAKPITVATTSPVALPAPTAITSAPVAAPAAIAPAVPTTNTTTSTTSNIVKVALMPAVDINKNILAATGFSDYRIKPTTEVGPTTGGAFRIVCTPSHMSNDDPIVYPNQKGAAHHHTFFGNTSVAYNSNLMAFSTTGNSTCKGGIMNRSAYWVPSMIDTATNTAKTPEVAIFYYKTGRTPGNLIISPPKGLRMIAGNSKATNSSTSTANFTCLPALGVKKPFYGWYKTIQNCGVGETMQMNVAFPQCWDGKNLDSPDHQSHMAYTQRLLTTANKCPATHPKSVPQVTVNFNYKITTANLTKNWRLASDNYDKSLAGGYSSHADWVNGWDEKIIAGFVKNCLNKNIDCHAHLLGDGRMFN